MPELGQLAYETYVGALGMGDLCKFEHLAIDIQRVWACVEATCQGKALVRPFYGQAPRQEESNHHE